jgi:hypothetical protein
MGCVVSGLNATITDRFEPSSIIHKEVCSPNLQYRQQNGGFQVKGNGALVLTNTVLWFTPVARCDGCICQLDDIEMFVDDIKNVTVKAQTPISYRSGGHLCIDCGNDKLYFLVRDQNAWKAAIDNVRHRPPNNGMIVSTQKFVLVVIGALWSILVSLYLSSLVVPRTGESLALKFD